MMKKLVHYSNKKIMIDTNITDEYIKLVKQRNKIDEKLQPLEEQLKAELKDTMELLGETDTDLVINGIIAKYKKASVRNVLDTSRLKTERQDIYKEYLTTSNVKSSLSLSIK